jgi:nucleotidyltransferase/DNA polymerase involved in DNA repair
MMVGGGAGVKVRIICVYFEHFAAAVETREHPELAHCPVVIGGYPHQRKHVLDCSGEAARMSVVVGMPLRQAHHLCPDAAFLPGDEDKYTRYFDEVLNILERFSPAVEAAELGKAFLDGSGLSGLYGPEESLALRLGTEILAGTCLRPKVGVASSKFVAEVAASLSSLSNPCIVQAGGEREFLQSLPSSLLPLSEGISSRFDMLGLRTMGQIATLPLEALAAQFGAEGILAHQLANGIDNRPLVPRPKPVVLEAELTLDSHIDSLDGMLSAVEKLLDRLIPVLRRRNQTCLEIRLSLQAEGASSWDKSLFLKEPTDSKQEIIGLLRHRLESLRLPAGITGVRLGLTHLSGERAKQGLLLQREKLKQEEQLKRSARQLKARLGKNPLKRVIPLDPASRIPERRSALTDLEL